MLELNTKVNTYYIVSSANDDDIIQNCIIFDKHQLGVMFFWSYLQCFDTVGWVTGKASGL